VLLCGFATASRGPCEGSMASRAHEHRPRRPKRNFQATSVDATKAAQLIIDCKYANELPQPPVPKLLKALPTAERLCQYAPTSLELDHRPFLLSEKGLASRIELVDPNAYGELPAEWSMPPPPPPQDAQLLRDDDISEAVKEAEKKRQRLNERSEAWHREAFGLQVPQLVTNDVFTERQRFTVGLEAAEKTILRQPPNFNSLDDFADQIENTFEAAKDTPVHPSNPSLKPKRVLPIVPDAVLWANRYRQISFDELPQKPQNNDLLFKTAPNPRITCFGLFSSAATPEGTSGDEYKLAMNYVWDNRGAFTRSTACGENDTVMLSYPDDSEETGEVRFVPMPSVMRLKKQKAHRLDISLEAQMLNVKHRDPSVQEAAEEQERMNAVLNDEVRGDDEASFDYVDGEWQIRGDPRQTSSREPSTPPTKLSTLAAR